MQATNKGWFHTLLIRVVHSVGWGHDQVYVMYLKKVNGLRAVTLPDGTTMTQADLPPANTRRWVARRKADVVRGVVFGLIPLQDALQRYDLSAEEFLAWQSAVAKHGEAALKTTSLQRYRQL